MPRSKSIKTIIAEIVIYVGMFAVVGHMSQNLYERFLMQSEISTMKSELNSLELIVRHIELAYDVLCEDIRELLVNKESGKPLELKAPNIRSTYDSYILHKPNYSYKRNVPETQDVETNSDKITQDFMQNFKRSTNNFLQYWRAPASDKTTFTESLLRCVNVGVNKNKESDMKGFCKCIVKCLSHNDDSYKLVNFQKADKILGPVESKLNVYHVISNETNSKCPENEKTL